LKLAFYFRILANALASRFCVACAKFIMGASLLCPAEVSGGILPIEDKPITYGTRQTDWIEKGRIGFLLPSPCDTMMVELCPHRLPQLIEHLPEKEFQKLLPATRAISNFRGFSVGPVTGDGLRATNPIARFSRHRVLPARLDYFFDRLNIQLLHRYTAANRADRRPRFRDLSITAYLCTDFFPCSALDGASRRNPSRHSIRRRKRAHQELCGRPDADPLTWVRCAITSFPVNSCIRSNPTGPARSFSSDRQIGLFCRDSLDSALFASGHF